MTARIKSANLACYCDHILALALYWHRSLSEFQGPSVPGSGSQQAGEVEGGKAFNRG